MRSQLIYCLVLAGVGVLATDVSAQRGSTSTGTFGSRTVGGGGGLSAGSGNAFGSGGGQGDALQGTTAGNRLEQLIGGEQVGGVQGNERFVRGNRQAGQFVGGSTADAFVGSMTGSANGFNAGNFAAGLGQRNNRNNTNQNRNNSQRKINVRTQLSIGFRYPKLRTSVIQMKTRTLMNSKSIARLGPIEVDVVDRTARLRGVVANEADRELAVRLVRLEPGISKVEDELVVDASVSDEVSPSDPQ